MLKLCSLTFSTQLQMHSEFLHNNHANFYYGAEKNKIKMKKQMQTTEAKNTIGKNSHIKLNKIKTKVRYEYRTNIKNFFF